MSDTCKIPSINEKFINKDFNDIFEFTNIDKETLNKETFYFLFNTTQLDYIYNSKQFYFTYNTKKIALFIYELYNACEIIIIINENGNFTYKMYSIDLLQIFDVNIENNILSFYVKKNDNSCRNFHHITNNYKNQIEYEFYKIDYDINQLQFTNTKNYKFKSSDFSTWINNTLQNISSYDFYYTGEIGFIKNVKDKLIINAFFRLKIIDANFNLFNNGEFLFFILDKNSNSIKKISIPITQCDGYYKITLLNELENNDLIFQIDYTYTQITDYGSTTKSDTKLFYFDFENNKIKEILYYPFSKTAITSYDIEETPQLEDKQFITLFNNQYSTLLGIDEISTLSQYKYTYNTLSFRMSNMILINNFKPQKYIFILLSEGLPTNFYLSQPPNLGISDDNFNFTYLSNFNFSNSMNITDEDFKNVNIDYGMMVMYDFSNIDPTKNKIQINSTLYFDNSTKNTDLTLIVVPQDTTFSLLSKLQYVFNDIKTKKEISLEFPGLNIGDSQNIDFREYPYYNSGDILTLQYSKDNLLIFDIKNPPPMLE